MAETGGGLFKRASVGITAAWLAVFAALPTLMVLGASFFTRGERDYLEGPLTLSAYERLLEPVFLGVFVDSFLLAGATTLLCLLVGYPFAWALASAPKRIKGILLLLVIIPFWTSSLIRTYALIILLGTGGLLNDALLWLGLVEAPLKLLYTQTAVVIGLVYALLPFMVLPLYAAVEKLDRRLLEASRDLGAGPAASFLTVALPQTAPGIVAGCMLTFLPSLCMFYIPDLLGGAKGMLVGNFIKNQFLTARDWPLGSAASVVLTAVMVLLLLVYFRAAGRRGEGEAGEGLA